VIRFALVVALLSGPVWAESKSVTKQEALRLVRAALPDWALKAGPVYVTPSLTDSNFYFFEASRSNPGGTGIVGHYAVHRTTGDVWDGVICQEYKPEAVLKLQVLIRKQLRLTEADYRKLKRLGPYCEFSK
jgi:hypothetical protein